MEQAVEALGFEPIMPRLSEIDPFQVVVEYDNDTDALYVHFFGTPQAATSVDVNHYLYVRVDRSTRAIVGLHFDRFLHVAVHDDPSWLVLAEMAGIEPGRLAEIRASIDPARQRSAALRTVLEELTLAVA